MARTLLAVALSAPSSSWEKCGWKRTPSKASMIVMSNPFYNCNQPYQETWADFDFGANEMYAYGVVLRLRTRLSDGDVGAILVCIKAIDNLKVLRLPHCFNIKGHCLAPLRGSVVLERVDLSLVSWGQSPVIDPNSLLCDSAVIPILHSIIDVDDNSLTHLQLPKIWKESFLNHTTHL
ncbi:hypothetical protein ACHAXR_005532 [Thalassiosira sp. AJA248-18]